MMNSKFKMQKNDLHAFARVNLLNFAFSILNLKVSLHQ
jgi:hypothetical protein